MRAREKAPAAVETGRGFRAFVRRHRVPVAVGAVISVALLVFVLVYFQPQKLFIDTKVNEALPTVAASPAASAPSTMRSGTFRSLAHPARGSAHVLEVGGRLVLRFEGFAVENGPDLFVLLSPTGSGEGDDAIARDAYYVSRLKGNVGAQNYTLPVGFDIARYRSVLIWCRRFRVGFAVAPLT